MALFEIMFELPGGADGSILLSAAGALGYVDAQVRSIGEAFGVVVSHPSSKFEAGTTIAKAILPHLPSGSTYLSHRLAASVHEMSEEDLNDLLREIEKSAYGRSGI
jgi:hypothetical protein